VFTHKQGNFIDDSNDSETNSEIKGVDITGVAPTEKISFGM